MAKEQIKEMKLILITSLSLLLSGCDTATDKSNVSQTFKKSSLSVENLNASIGWIHGACLAIKNGKIKSGTNVQVIVLSKPQKIIDSKVKGVAESEKECPALLSDRGEINKQDGRYFYNLDVSKEAQDMVAVGVVSTTVKARNINNIVEIDINNDGAGEYAGTCLTNEGVQFYISSSAAFNEKALWSDYYYLGYDTKPTCP